MLIKSGPIIYEIDNEKDFKGQKEVDLSFKSLWGLTTQELKDNGIIGAGNPAKAIQDENGHIHINSIEETLFDGLIQDQDTYIWIKKNQMILNLDNFDYTFIGQAQDLIKSVADYKNGFLTGKEKLKKKIYENGIERYYVTVKLDKANKYTVTIGKKKYPGFKEKKYTIVCDNVYTFMSKMKDCLRDYLEYLTKNNPIMEKERKRDEEELKERE